jgi:glycine cleavage system H protein
MSFEYPDDLKYLDSHEYVRIEGEVATIGISAFAIDQLGDIVFVELPEPGSAVVENNAAIADNPEQLADDPYGTGWLLKIKLNGTPDLSGMMAAADYRDRVEGH